MRYAVYISADNQPFEFSSSYSDPLAAQMEVDQINNWHNGMRAVILKVFGPNQLVDPFAADMWTLTITESVKQQAKKSREAAE